MKYNKDRPIIMKSTLLIFLVILSTILLSNLLFADTNWFSGKQNYNIKELKASGKITSLENILAKLAEYNIHRLLEVELKQKKSPWNNHSFIYEIEYINNKGVVLEIEVDALTAQILSIEHEH